MSELIFICPEAKYELYNILSKYFYVEIIDTDDRTMGVMDSLKVLIDPISKAIEIMGNIIISLINSKACTITIKNGDKEISFDGKIKSLSNEDIINLLNKIFEE